jgi:chromate transporter
MVDNGVQSEVGTPRIFFSPLEVFAAFLWLGCTSFGGPVAHLGYYRKELIERRHWCSEATYAEIVAVAQSLPGPASSQIAFSLGLLRAGWLGGLVAWAGFTLPSAVLMIWFALAERSFHGKIEDALLHGLQLAAVSVVAQAILAMRKSLTPDWKRLLIAIFALLIVMFAPATFGTFLAILAGALCGLLFVRSEITSPRLDFRISRTAGAVSVGLFAVLLVLSAVTSKSHPGLLQIAASFYLSGALVFGGGHVVLPLLDHAVVSTGWVTQQTFLAGYGAVQAAPGPLFTFAAFLGTAIQTALPRVAGGLIALIAIFFPGLLLMTAALAFWSKMRRSRIVADSLRGVNASVVGVLAAAFIRPVCTAALHSVLDVVIAVAALALLTLGKVRPLVVVTIVAAATLLTER